jgi:phosphatidylinositol phospholipase C beta
MSELVNYCTPYHFSGFGIAHTNNNCYHISSFPEKRGTRYVASHPTDFVDYTRMQMARIYPAGTRTSSSNFNPQLFWNAGCQLVALNYQTPGYAMQLNHAKFDVNGRTGYVLKPNIMTDKMKIFDPLRKDPLEEHVPLDVTVRVISGTDLGEGTNPLVECQLFGLSCYTQTKWHTRPYRGKSVLARWNSDNVTTFCKIILTDLAIVRFNVRDGSSEGEELGWAAFSLDSVRPGYRYIALRNGRRVTSRLLVHISMKIYAPDAHTDFSDRIFNPTAHEGAYTRNMKAMEVLIDHDEEEDTSNVFNKFEAMPSGSMTLSRTDTLDISSMSIQASFRRNKDFTTMFQQAVSEAMDDSYSKKMKSKLKEKVEKLQTKLDKSLASIYVKHEKAVRSVLGSIRAKLQAIISSGRSDLKKANSRLAKASNDMQIRDATSAVEQVRLQVHGELVDALLAFNRELIDLNLTSAREALPFKKSFADQKARMQREIQEAVHRKAEKQLTAILDEKAKMVFNEAKKSFDAETWKAMTEDHNRKLVQLSVNAIKWLNQRHQEADEFLAEQITIEDNYVTDSYAEELRSGMD